MFMYSGEREGEGGREGGKEGGREGGREGAGGRRRIKELKTLNIYCPLKNKYTKQTKD